MKKMIVYIVLLALILQPGLDAIQTLAAQGNILDEAVRPKSQATSKTSDAASAVNYALNFDGADDYIEVPNSASLNPAQITVGVWAKSANKTWNATGSLVSKRDVFIVHPESGSRNIKFFIFSGGWVSANFNAPYDFDITKWHHYAGTFDGKAVRIYIDGKLVGETLRSGNINTGDTRPLFIGKDDGTARYFSGMIDDIRIWDRALDQAEIEASVYPPGVYPENLKASWQFNQGSGIALTDSSGNNNTGTLKNGPAWKSISGLTGRVTDPEGAGISGVKIFAARPKQFLPLIFTKSGGTTTSSAPVSSPTNPLEVIPVVTDAEGYYSVPYLSQGRYIVTAEQDSVVFTPASRAALLPEAPVADFHVEIIPAKIPETTQVLSAETKQSLQSVSADGSVITFTQATPQLQQLSPGDILVSEEVSGTTDGMIRKVMDIKNTESGLVVDTEAAALEDAIEDGATYDTGDLAPSDVISATMIQGVEMLSPTSPDSLGFRLGVKDAVIYDADNNLATIGDQVRASGSIEFVLDFQFYLEFKAFKLNSLLLANKETLNDSIEVYSGADLAGFQWQKILGTVKFKKIRFMIGAVPIYIHPTMDILLGVDGNVSIGMSTSLGHKFTMRTGISYTSSSGWRPIAEASSKLVFTPPHPLLSAGIYAYIGAKFNFYLYGVAGPYGQFTPYTEFTVAPLEDPWWTLYAGLDLRIGFSVANKFNRILKVSPYEVATIELIKPILLARSESTDKAPNTPLVASPDDGAPNQALHVDLSWTGSDPDGDMLYFDVYFGNSNPPADLVSRGQLTTVTDVGELAPSTPYYWKVVAWDEHGLSKAGPVWSFTTGYRVAGDMVTIPAGLFWMGCDSVHNGGFTCDDDALPLRQVTLDAYRIDVFEVSESLYKVCMDAGVCPWLIIQSMDNPIITTWNQAQTYCTWAGKRLPTEAEWEKAARGDQDTRAYPWGDQQPDCTLANIGAQLVIGGCSGFPWFFPVDSFPDGASPYGVINMAGNVMEWVSDWYQADYYTGSSAYNPPGPETGVNKVIRGGNINATDYFWFLVSHRWFESPGSYNGFRCAASVTP